MRGDSVRRGSVAGTAFPRGAWERGGAMPLRLVMMGTGEFALPTFRALYDTPHEVVGLFTQPDRTGRGHHQHPHPMKELALQRGTPVFQPEKVNTPEALERLRALRPDV